MIHPLTHALRAVRAYQAAIESPISRPLSYISTVASARVDAEEALGDAMRLCRSAMGDALAAACDEARIRIVAGGIDSRQLDALACMLARAEVRAALHVTTCDDAPPLAHEAA